MLIATHSFIMQYRLMERKDCEEQLFCSKVSLIPAYVRFINFTSCFVRIYWIDYDGNKRLYNTIGPDDFLDVNTFVTHLWIFENNETGDRLLGEWSYVFYPHSWEKDKDIARRIDPRFRSAEIAVRRIIPITYPLYSLKMRALQVVRDSLENENYIKDLEIPDTLKKELQILIKRKYCLLKHSPRCNRCSN